jgi:perosamine synthetase
MEKLIPVCEPYLWQNEKKYVMDALESGWISSAGKYLTDFEAQFARYCGVEHGIAVANGTVALHLAVLAAGIKPGDEVIISDFTMIAPVLALMYVGARPVFVDADPETWNMRTDQIEARITSRTKAILAVHIYGHPCDMDEINAIAKRHGIKVIEDAAEVHGATVRGRRCGSLSDIATFSFYANKIVMTGEGGMVLTSNAALAEHVRQHRNLCFGAGLQRYLHPDIGFNYRLTNLQAAIGLGQLEHVDEAVERKRRIAHDYNRMLADVDGLTLPVERDWAKNVYWVYGIVVQPSFGITRDALALRLKERGIETRLFFAGMHEQPFLKQFVLPGQTFPATDVLAKGGLYLPSFMHITDEQMTRVVDAIRSIRKGA